MHKVLGHQLTGSLIFCKICAFLFVGIGDTVFVSISLPPILKSSNTRTLPQFPIYQKNWRGGIFLTSSCLLTMHHDKSLSKNLIIGSNKINTFKWKERLEKFCQNKNDLFWVPITNRKISCVFRDI